MAPDFSSIRNGLESAVFNTVLYRAAQYPSIAVRDELIVDVACIALNHLPARYFHSIPTPIRDDKTIDRAVVAAYDCVYARTALLDSESIGNLHAEIEGAGAI